MLSRVVVNGRFLFHKVTGVERYANEVTQRLGNRVQLIQPGMRASGAFGHAWEQLVLPTRLAKGDLLWSPTNTGPLTVHDQVITIHDISFLDHPEWFQQSFVAWYRYLIPRLVRRTRIILTVSYFSYIRILEAFQISAERVKIVPAGVDLNKFKPATQAEVSAIKRKFHIGDQYLLAMGTLEPRKNLEKLFEAWQNYSSNFRSNLELVVAGGKGASFRNMPRRVLPEGVKLLGYVDEADLPGLYSGALVYILPSVYEGFGLTALEAMACGAPVAVSNTSALPEVVGNAGIYFDPVRTDEIWGVIETLYSSPKLREQLITSGFKQAEAFPWENSARLTWEILSEAM
jgi:glycosyltransferase involved in cell wall biosynthesis